MSRMARHATICLMNAPDLLSQALRKARALLEGETPLNRDCGGLCGAACCQPDEDGLGGMLLFPGEAAFYHPMPEGFQIEREDSELSTKRIRKRIERDKLRRSEKNNAFMNKYDNFDNIITYQNYYQSLENCNKGVGYKRSVQEFNQNAITQIHEIIGTIESGQIPALSKVKKVSIALFR